MTFDEWYKKERIYPPGTKAQMRMAFEAGRDVQSDAGVPDGCVAVSRSFLEATPCPNCDGSGFFTSTGPDPEQEQCQWCFEKHMILSGAERTAPSPDTQEEG